MSKATGARAGFPSPEVARGSAENSLCAGGIALGSTVLTLDGALPVEHLTPGDRIITRAGARTLRDIAWREVPATRMILIGASSIGHDRPDADLLVAPDQPVLVRDWRAKAMFGAAQAHVAAARLVDGTHIRRTGPITVRLFTLRFDSEEVIYANGLELVCTPAPVAA